MSSRIFLYIFFTFCTVNLLNPSLIFAQSEACTFSNSDIEGVEVIQIGQQQIYTLFTALLLDEADEALEIINSYRPLLDAVVPLNELIDEYRLIIASEQSDAQKIAEVVESGEIDWIGFEHPRTDATYVDDAKDSYLGYRSEINMELDQSAEWNSNKTDQLLSLMFEPHIVARATHSDIFRRVRTYLLENMNFTVEEWNLIEYLSYWENRIREDHRVTEAQHLEISSFIGGTMEPEPRLITESQLEALLNRLEIPEEARTNIKSLIRVHNNIMSLYSRSDRAAVQSVLGLSGNGFLLFGRDRSYGIKQSLIAACQNRNDSP